MDGVLQDHHGLLGIVVAVHVAAARLNDGLAVIGIQLGQCLAPDDPARVVRDRDDVFDHHIVGVHVEEVVAIDQAVKGFGDHVEVGPHRGILRHVSRRHGRLLFPL